MRESLIRAGKEGPCAKDVVSLRRVMAWGDERCAIPFGGA